MNCPTIFDACVPRGDVIDGSFTESDFAADLASVLKGTAPVEYRKPEKFFAQTYPTEGIKTLLKSVCSRLAGSGESVSPIFRLDTNYGGGKTHALIALAHAAKGLQGVMNAEEFLPPEHIPHGHVRLAAFDGENADPNNGRPLEDGIRAYTPWGEIAYFLAGAKGYELVRRSDESHGAPGAETIQQLFGDEPTLILIDELSVYLRKLAQGSTRDAGGQLTAFLTALFKAVESTPQAAVVYTLAVGKQRVATDAYREENQYIADAMAEAEAVSARKATLLDPTEEDETVRVLVRRLFERVDEDKAAEVVACYRDLWTQNREWLPEDSLGEQRVNAFASGYPFHPELIETLRNKTATLNNFQRVRGMLRILGQSIRRLWQQRPKDAHALHLHHIDPGFDPIRKEITTRLGLGQFLPALRSDVAAIEGEQPALAQQLDTKHYVGLTAYGSHVGRAIFLHSLAFNEQLKGASKEGIRYAILSPASEVSFIDDAVTRFQGWIPVGGRIVSQGGIALIFPSVFTREEDVGPAEWRYVRQQVVRTVEACAFSLCDGLPEMLGVPVYDDGGQQVQSGHAVMLALGCSIADFTLATDSQGVFQGVMGLALVETDLSATLHVGIEQPVDNKERAFDTPDFTQGKRQLMLAGIGSKLLQQLAGGHDPRRHRGHGAQEVGPVLGDQAFSDLAPDQPAQFFRGGCRVEEIEPLGRQVSNAGDEPVGQECGDGEDMVGEAAGVGRLFLDPATSLVHQQPVEDIGCLVHRGRDGLGGKGAELIGEMGVSLYPRLRAIFGVDEVHCFGVSGSREELPVTGCGDPGTPEPGHGQA